MGILDRIRRTVKKQNQNKKKSNRKKIEANRQAVRNMAKKNSTKKTRQAAREYDRRTEQNRGKNLTVNKFDQAVQNLIQEDKKKKQEKERQKEQEKEQKKLATTTSFTGRKVTNQGGNTKQQEKKTRGGTPKINKDNAAPGTEQMYKDADTFKAGPVKNKWDKPTHEDYLSNASKKNQMDVKVFGREKDKEKTAKSVLADEYHLIKKNNPKMSDEDIYTYLEKVGESGGYGENFTRQAAEGIEAAKEKKLSEEYAKHIEENRAIYGGKPVREDADAASPEKEKAEAYVDEYITKYGYENFAEELQKSLYGKPPGEYIDEIGKAAERRLEEYKDIMQSTTRDYKGDLVAAKNKGYNSKPLDNVRKAYAADDDIRELKNNLVSTDGARKAANALESGFQSGAASMVNAVDELTGRNSHESRRLKMSEDGKIAVYIDGEFKGKIGRDSGAYENLLAEYNEQQKNSAAADYIEAAEQQQAALAGTSGLGKYGLTALNAAAAQVPAYAVGGTVGKGLGMVGMGLQSLGGGLVDAEQNGATNTEKWVSAAGGAVIEAVLSGIPIGRLNKILNNKGVKATVEELKKTGIVKSILGQAGSEYAEEALTTFLQNTLNEFTYIHDLDKMTVGEWLGQNASESNYAGLVGAGMGGAMGAVGHIAGSRGALNPSADNVQQQVQQQNQQIDNIAQGMIAGTQTAGTANAINAAAEGLKAIQTQAATERAQTNSIVNSGNVGYNNINGNIAENMYGNNDFSGGSEYGQETENDNGAGTRRSDEVGISGESGAKVSGERSGYTEQPSGNSNDETMRAQHDGRGYSRLSANIRQPINHKEPQRIIADVRRESKNGACVDEPTPADYASGKVRGFVSEDGEATISVKSDGDIVALGKTKDCTVPGAARKLMYTALQNGGNKLDCYGEYLVKYYQKEFGMIPVAKVKYNPEYADDNMKAYVQNVRGGVAPDIYVMMHNGDSVETIEQTKRNGGYELTDLESLPVMEYDEALAYRDGLLIKPNKDNLPLQNNQDMQGGQPEPGGTQQRKTYQSFQDAEVFSDEFKARAADNEVIRDYKEISNEETTRSALEYIQENGVDGARVETMEALENGSATAKDLVVGFELMRHYDSRGEYDAAIEIAEKISEANTRGGQLIQANAILKRMSPEGMLLWGKKTTDTAIRKIAEKKGKVNDKNYINELKEKHGLNEEDAGYIIERMKKVQELPDGREKDILLGEVQARIFNKLPAAIGSSFKAWARISMLFNPKTLITRNAGSNAGVAVLNSLIVDPIAAIFDKQMAKKTGVRTTGAGMKGYGKNMAGGISTAFDDYKRGINTRELQLNGDRWETGASHGKSFNAETLNKFDRLTSFLLDAGDRPFAMAEYQKSLSNQMKANGVTEPTEAMRKVAAAVAMRRTWQDNNMATEAGFKIVHALNFGYEFGLGTLIAPFVKTPVNLAIATIEYSPIGLIKTLAVDGKRLKKAIANGNDVEVAQNRFVENFGKAAAGTLVSLVGMALSEAGILNGGEDDDWDKNNYMKNVLGIQPYSIKIGDKTYTYSWALPIGGNLGATADIIKNVKNNKDASGIAGDAAKLVLNNIITSLEVGGSFICDQTFLQSMQSVFGEENLIDGLKKAFPGMVTQFVPFGSLMGQVAMIMDDTQRRTTGKDKSDIDQSDLVQAALHKVQGKMPWYSKQLEPVLDAFGREQQRFASDNIFMKAVQAFINPANVKKENTGAVDNEIIRLYDSLGDDSLFPKVQDYKITLNYNDYELTAKEYTAYQKNYGNTAYAALSKVMATDDYKGADDATKAEMVKLAYEYGTNFAKKKYFAGKGVDYEVDGWIKTMNEENIPISDAISIKAATGKLSLKTYKAKGDMAKLDISYKDFAKVSKEIDGMTCDRYPDTGKAVLHSKPGRGLYSKQDKIKKYLKSLGLTKEQYNYYYYVVMGYKK
ncbi:MAG: hypothetical protein ACOX7J_00290 [Bacillota bacterium]|jgi:hypothetical protein